MRRIAMPDDGIESLFGSFDENLRSLEASLGVRLPVVGRATEATAQLQGGVEHFLGPGWALGATVGVRWLAGESAAGEAALGVRRYF